jgi:ring-1,2-phenylacetyl-CoA epoxidase subunit PaaD
VSTATASRAWVILAGVPDPEIPVVSVVDLGIVRDVEESADGRAVTVTLTPTYSGCPATEVISRDVRTALESTYDVVRVETVLTPAWTTDWLTDAGREKLHAFGIAPPSRDLASRDVSAGRAMLPVLTVGTPESCPRCGSTEVEELAGFGSTPCKAVWRCTSCREPFDYFKKH